MTRHPTRVLTLSAVLLLVLLAGFVVALSGTQGKSREDLGARFAERARMSAALTQAVFTSSSSSGAVEATKRFGAPVGPDATLTRWAKRNRMTDVVLLDARGRVLAASDGTPAAFRRSLGRRTPYVAAVLAGAPYGLSDVQQAGGMAPSIQYAQAFPTISGRRVLVSGFPPALLYQFFGAYLKEIPTSGGSAYVLDSRGAVVGAPIRTGRTRAAAVIDPGLATATVGRSRGTFGSEYFASSPVAHSTWRVVLTAPSSTLFASVRGLRVWVPWFIFAAFALAAVAAFAQLRRASRSAEQLQRAQERYALVVRGANDGIWDHDLVRGELYLSPRWKEMLGLPREMAPSPDAWLSRVHPDDLESLREATQQHRAAPEALFVHEHRMRHTDGHYRWMLVRGVAVRDGAGKVTRMAGSMSDITARREAEEQLRMDALHDGLTGLANRKLFTDRLEVAVARASRDPSRRCAVLFLDLDRFKLINDSFSHTVGDELLMEVGRRLDNLLRPGDTLARGEAEDTVARLGGDEFTILLEDVQSPEVAQLVAERILAALEEPFFIDGRHIFVTGSIGMSFSGGGADAGELMRNADLAMYEAKRQGPSRVSLYTDDLHEHVTGRLLLETSLRTAIEERKMRVFYQPIIELAGGRLTGLEALVRWPEGQAQIGPAEFVPIAEETGLIAPLSRFVLTTACRQLGAWRAAGLVGDEVTLSVNISGQQFNEPDVLLTDVRSALREGGLPACALRLEITEGTLITDPERLEITLSKLRAMGVRTHIDDFGTGYSSLTVLQHFSGDTLKIDRSFIAGMHEEDGHHEIVRAIISLAHNLGLRTIAEGIDHPEQLARLRALGCEDGQGFLFSEAVPDDQVAALVGSWDVAMVARHYPAQTPTGA